MTQISVERNCIVSIIYTVSDAVSNRILQQVTNPEEFLIGHQLLIDDFENNLLGLLPGANFSFQVEAERAYGPVDPHAIFDLPITVFEEENGEVDDNVVQVGHVFPMEDKFGNRHYGKIIRKMKDSVTMDFNHPLAGKNLSFTGEVIAVRKAQTDELPQIN